MSQRGPQVLENNPNNLCDASIILVRASKIDARYAHLSREYASTLSMAIFKYTCVHCNTL